MWPMSALAQQALTRSRGLLVRATAYTAALGELPVLISGGTVTIDTTSQVRRTATVQADPRLWPDTPLGVLSPWGTELQLWYGIPIPGSAVEWVPLIRGVIRSAKRTIPADNDATITIELSDRSFRVAEDRFESPRQTITTNTVVAEIRRLITESLPDATVLDLTGSTQTAASMELSKDRWGEGVEKLADSIGAECFADPIGRFVIRPVPSLSDSPQWRIRSGPGGILLARDEERTREQAANRIVVSGQRADGSAVVLATVTDTDPTSPTVYGGAFGRKTFFYNSPLLTTTAQATAAGTALLARRAGFASSGAVTAMVNPGLDVGDVIAVEHQRTTSYAIVDRLTVPLGPADAQSIDTRSTGLPQET